MLLCLEFQEAYKSLDKLCRECLSSYDGVSGYIRLMESEWYGEQYVSTWNSDLKKLKHVRWVRNQLSHEVGTLESNICSQFDLEFVDDFYERIMNTTDPLAILRKAQEIENQQENNLKQEYNQSNDFKQENNYVNDAQNSEPILGYPHYSDQWNELMSPSIDGEKPFLRKVWEKIKNFFS